MCPPCRARGFIASGGRGAAEFITAIAALQIVVPATLFTGRRLGHSRMPERRFRFMGGPPELGGSGGHPWARQGQTRLFPVLAQDVAQKHGDLIGMGHWQVMAAACNHLLFGRAVP